MASVGQAAVTEAVDHSLTEKLLDERTAGQLVQLLDRLEAISFLAEALEDFLRRGPEMAGAVNELVILLREGMDGSDVQNTVGNALTAMRRMREIVDSPQARELFRSDVLDLRSIDVVGKAARSLVAASEEVKHKDPKPMGIIGLMRLMTDPEIQPAIHFLAAFLRQFSRELQNARAVHRP